MSWAAGASSPRSTRRCHSRATPGSRQGLYPPRMPDAIDASGPAAPASPEVFTSTRVNPPAAPSSEGRPPFAPCPRPPPCPPRPPRPFAGGAAAAVAGFVAGAAGLSVAVVVAAGVAGVAAAAAEVAGVGTGVGAGGGAIIAAIGRKLSVHSGAGASGATPISLESFAKPSISTSIFQVPSASSGNAYSVRFHRWS